MDWLEGILRFLGNAASSVWDIITGIPQFLFGDSLDSGWGIVFAIYTTAVFFGFIITGFAISRELLKALDVRFDKEWLDEHNSKLPEAERQVIDWTLARQQRVRSLGFTLPVGAMVLASLYIWVGRSFTGVTYATFAAVWFGIGLVLLRPWWVATVVRTARIAPPKRHKDYANPGEMTVSGAFGHYMKWGLEGSSKRRKMFIRLLRVINWLASILRLQWFRVRLLWALTWWLAVALTWPLGMVIALSKMGWDFTKKEDPLLMPLWSKSRADQNEPPYTGERWASEPARAEVTTKTATRA